MSVDTEAKAAVDAPGLLQQVVSLTVDGAKRAREKLAGEIEREYGRCIERIRMSAGDGATGIAIGGDGVKKAVVDAIIERLIADGFRVETDQASRFGGQRLTWEHAMPFQLEAGK